MTQPIRPIYLVDPSGQQWLLRVDNNAVPQLVPVSGADAKLFVYLNSVTDGASYKVSVALLP